MLAIVIIVVSNIELSACKNKSKYVIDIPDEAIVILPEEIHSKYPVYIYNSSKVKRDEIKYDPSYSKTSYEKFEIPLHIATKITQPIKDMFKGLFRLPKTRMPVNTLYNMLNKSDKLMSNINPLVGQDKSKYKMLVSAVDVGNLEIFMDDKIYVMD